MHLPDYKKSIVNLVASITSACGGTPTYRPLPASLLPSRELADARHVVLLVLDGLGYEFCKQYDQVSGFTPHMRGSLTSVFPSTTASAITSLATGVAPQQHAITGWFMYMKEIDAMCAPLQFTFRSGNLPLDEHVDPSLVLDQVPINAHIPRRCNTIQPADIVKSTYTRAIAGSGRLRGYDTTEGFLRQITASCRQRESSFTYAYWPYLDSVGHLYGMDSDVAFMHFLELNEMVSALMQRLKGTGTKFVITADHGQIEAEKTVDLRNHPRLQKMLTQHISGEPRTAYCYVHPRYREEFERYVRTKLDKYCWLYRSQDLVKKGAFGQYRAHPKLQHRIGDYVLLMKENYIIFDPLATEGEQSHVGVHGGVSREEMHVPLIVPPRL